MSGDPIIVIGAGISGVTVAKNIRRRCIVLEETDMIGGLSTQYKSGDYWFDYGGHYFHFKDKQRVKDYLETFHLFEEYNRVSKAFLLNRYIPFPVQFHLSYFPKKIAQSIMEEILNRKDTEADNLFDHLCSSFGSTLFRLFFEPFMSKYYGFDLRQMAARMDKGSIPVPDRETVRQGLDGKRFTDAGYNPVFYYPRKGLRGFFEDYSEDVKDQIQFQQKVIEVDLQKKSVRTRDNEYKFERLVSTMPLKSLLSCLKQKDRLPSPQRLNHTSTLICNIVLKKRRRRFHWLYLPERRFAFYRAGFYPSRQYPVCYLEKSLPPGSDYDPNSVKAELVFTLKELGLIDTESDIVHIDIKIIPISYIIFDHHWHATIPGALASLRQYGIYSIGRFGSWTYSSMSDDVQSAMRAADEINKITGRE